MVDIIEQMRELLTIRDRKIELQAKEIELLKKLLALQKPKDLDPRDREPDKYPHYDELIRRP
jgi:hypothetical protein